MCAIDTLLLESYADESNLVTAEELVRQPTVDVTQKAGPPPGGTLRDFSSQGPYWWPDPGQPDGRPYIRRDGELNPESRVGNAPDLEEMAYRVHVLTRAWKLSKKARFAEAAAAQIRAWFLNASTGMTPHLEFAQAIPGRCNGRGIGIIETEALVTIPDDSTILLESDFWTEADHTGLKNWFRAYLGWMLCSENGKNESTQHNNHGTWYDAQVAVFALFGERPEIAAAVLQYSLPERLEAHIAADGSQPHELARTLSWNYSLFNLQAFLTCVCAGKKAGIDLTAWRGQADQSIGKALRFLIEYAPGNGKVWEWTQIKPREEADSRFQTWGNILQRAKCAFCDDQDMLEIIKKEIER